MRRGGLWLCRDMSPGGLYGTRRGVGSHKFKFPYGDRKIWFSLTLLTTLCVHSSVYKTVWQENKMDLDWVFSLLITGHVSTNLSQCQMRGQIHVPNSVCRIRPNPRGSQSHHLGTGVQLSHVIPSISCPLSVPVHSQDKKHEEILGPHHSTQHYEYI